MRQRSLGPWLWQSLRCFQLQCLHPLAFLLIIWIEGQQVDVSRITETGSGVCNNLKALIKNCEGTFEFVPACRAFFVQSLRIRNVLPKLCEVKPRLLQMKNGSYGAGGYPPIEFGLGCDHRTGSPATWPTNRQSQFAFVALHCANSLVQVVRNFLPPAEDFKGGFWLLHAGSAQKTITLGFRAGCQNGRPLRQPL